MNGKLNLLLLVILGLFLGALVSRSRELALMALPFLGCVLGGLLTAPRQVRLRASRALTQVRAEANTPVTMTVMIENEGPAIPRLHIQDTVWSKMRVTIGSAEEWVNLPAGGKVELRYTFQAERGQYTWEGIQVTASDPFGLFETALALPALVRVRVLPETLPLHRLRLQPRQTLRATGQNLSRLPGAGVDFYGVRPYHPGDSVRWIHWRLSARHPLLFFTKDFEREEMADIGLLLDARAANYPKPGTADLFESAVQAAAALAKSVLGMGNRVSLLALGSRVTRVFPDSGKRQLVRILDTLAGVEPGENVSLETLKFLPVRLFPSHSLIIVISPLRHDHGERQRDIRTLARLRADGYQVLLVSPDPVRFACQEEADTLAARAAQLERTALLWRMREMGVEVVDWPVDQPLMNSIRAMPRARMRG